MNQITLIGKVFHAPVYHCTATGQDLVRFELSTESLGGAGKHHCTAWGPAALDLHEHLRQGDRILIRGELLYRRRKDRRGSLLRMPEIYVRGYTYLGEGALERLTSQSLRKKQGIPG